MKKTILFLCLTPLLSHAQAYLPDAPTRPASHAPLPTSERFLLVADAASRALDVYSTHWMLGQGDREKLLPGFVAHHVSVMAAYSGATVLVDYLAARHLVRHHHSTLARLVTAVDLGQDAPWAVRNLFLPRRAK